MPTIIKGYNYDIFISYRQKDNKHDGWVTEFVDNLKGELEATFKEEISVYFDINQHDGLLETHDVDASLKEKLKCLVFIPIISRTYCDPKSFAWEHEFKEFVEQASQDQFGLKVKLPNGNVASRVLPVKIYDLDNADIKLCESLLDGVLRGIEFIFKSTGVNRPLSPFDNPEKNLNKTYYRDQINKVANAIKEVISGLTATPNSPLNERILHEEIFDKTDLGARELDQRLSFKINKNKVRKLIPWSLATLMVIMNLVLGTVWYKNFSKPLFVHKSIFNLPRGENIGINDKGSSVAFSPDGTMLIYVARENDTTMLKLLRMDEFEAKPIHGTTGAEAPFFSPDNNWVAFFADGKLKKVSILGGSLQTICDARSGFEGCWGRDNNIIYADSYKACLLRVPSMGGTPEQLTSALNFSIGEGEHSHFWPKFLPKEDKILFTIWHNSEDMRIVAYSMKKGRRWNLIETGNHATYVKTGHLIYTWKGDLLAVPFNNKKIEVTGQPVLILNSVMRQTNFSISDNGSLAYVSGDIKEPETMLVLVDQNGKSESLNVPAGQSPRFSPDGRQILYEWNQGLANIWLYELERGTKRRFTEKEYETFWAIWSTDSKSIIFNSNIHGGNAVTLFRKKADATGQTIPVATSNYHQQPKCWADDGKLLIYTEGINPRTGMDIFQVQTEGDTTPKPIFNSRFNETHPDLSHDGHWLTYVSDESGQEEVFICSFPELNQKTQISINGGTEPLWSPDGKKLYYRDIIGDKLMAVSFDANKELIIGKPILLFSGNYKGSSGPWGRNYDITPDGKKFLMIEEGQMTSTATQINIILNWTEDLKHIETSKKPR